MSATATVENIGAKPFSDDKKKAIVRTAGIVAAAGLVLGAAGYMADRERFAVSYLVGFLWVLTVALGALFFIIVQHLTRAGWSVAARRPMEWVASSLPACGVLFLPIVVFAPQLFHVWMSPAPGDHLIHGKHGYLNPTFFYIRAAFYFAVWIGSAYFFAKKSADQDKSGDPKLTESMQKVSAPAVLLFGITITFAAFDWIMSLDGYWYSTIFGVYVFAGAFVGGLAALALITVRMQRSGVAGKASTVEHMHDVGKLLFAFTIFWAYIAFAQFILIWYANIPEETVFYRERWVNGWSVVSLALLFGHFVIPFVGLLSRHPKRNPTTLGFFAVLMLVMHYVDLYWLVVPNFAEHPTLSWVDLGGLLLPLGVAGVAAAMAAQKTAAYPLKDPRLPESLRVENL